MIEEIAETSRFIRHGRPQLTHVEIKHEKEC